MDFWIHLTLGEWIIKMCVLMREAAEAILGFTLARRILS